MNNRELDKEVATKIFKFAVIAKNDDFYVTSRSNFSLKLVPFYSSNLDAAYLVLTHMRNGGFSYNVGSKIQNNELIWVASFHSEGSEPLFFESHSLSSAICLAALGAKSRGNNLPGLVLTDSTDSNERIVSIEDYRKK